MSIEDNLGRHPFFDQFARPQDLESARREALRRTLADAASEEDADTARLLEMCAEDLSRVDDPAESS